MNCSLPPKWIVYGGLLGVIWDEIILVSDESMLHFPVTKEYWIEALHTSEN